MKIPKEYAYLFNGSKRYYDFTDEEKAIYSNYRRLDEQWRERFGFWFPIIVSLISIIISVVILLR